MTETDVVVMLLAYGLGSIIGTVLGSLVFDWWERRHP